tara:strand:- start:675 stop:1289 length:615 start_codon:yes stop_codon:yes gene_type:complete
MSEKTTFASVWATLSQVDVSDRIEKKQNLSFLSWAWAWGTLMENYPEAEYSFQEPESATDGSLMVFCTVTIDNLSRQMWLPVMDYKNKAIPNPNAFQLNTAKMRCLVKCLAMFGLGHYIYAGEDLPNAEADRQAEADKKAAEELAESLKPLTVEQLRRINGLIEETEADVESFYKYFKVATISELTTAQAEVAILKLETKKDGK